MGSVAGAGTRRSSMAIPALSQLVIVTPAKALAALPETKR